MIGAIDTVIARVIARVVGTAAVSSAESAALFDAKVAEIQRLLAEAYRHYFEHSDGYAKSGEGALSIHLPSYFWEANAENTPCVEIYSYVFGSGRHHSFTDIDEALAQVRTWHAEEMAYDHNKSGVRQMGETLGSGLTCGGHIHIEHPEPSARERLRRLVEDLGDQVQYDANRQPLEWGDRMAVLLLEDARLMLIRVANNINPPSYFDLMTKIGQLEHMTDSDDELRRRTSPRQRGKGRGGASGPWATSSEQRRSLRIKPGSGRSASAGVPVSGERPIPTPTFASVDTGQRSGLRW